MNKPLINLVHANGFPAGSYQTFLAEFTSLHNIVAHPQYGHNDQYPIHSNWRFLVAELVEFLQQQDEKVICIGHSFGGIISFMAACKHPELFRGLIMLDPPVVTGPFTHILKLIKKTRLIDNISPAGKAVNRQRYWPLDTDLVDYFSKKGLFSNFDPRCLEDYVTHGVIETNNQLELRFQPEVEADIFRHLPNNLTRYKDKLRVPAALIYGEKTDIFPIENFSRFAKLNHIAVHSIPNGGHMFPLEQPTATANLIQKLIKNW